MKAALSISLVLLLFACSKDDDPQSELEFYTDKFFEEAAARNITLDRSNLTVKFVDVSEVLPGYATGSQNPPIVKISNQIWGNIGPVKKEILMFHELAHAVLGRLHTDEKLPNCIDYKSLMIGVDQFAYFKDDDLFTERRKYYVDELFNQDTPYPSWGGTMPANKKNIDISLDDWKYYPTDGTNHEGTATEEDQSLTIQSKSGQRGDAYWQLTIPGGSMSAGASISLEFEIKTIDVVDATGTGAYFEMFGQGTTPEFLAYRWYLGSTDGWQTQKVVLNCYPSSKPDVFIRLHLYGPASGTVLFKGIKVASYN